jgi:hypothetical protein
MRWMNAMCSASMRKRPTLRERQRQNRSQLRRCHAVTVQGLTTSKQER